MPMALVQSVLGAGADVFTATAGFLMEIDVIQNHMPKVHRALQHFCETDEAEKRRIVLLTTLGTSIGLALWYAFREKPKKQKLRLR